MTNQEKQLRSKLKELGYCLKVSTAKTQGTPISVGDDMGLYQISDGHHIVAGYRYELTLEDVERWISTENQNNEWLLCGGDGE